MYKELIQLITKSLKKIGRELNRHFPKEDMQMANGHTRSCSILLIIREVQIKPTMRYDLIFADDCYQEDKK